MSNANVGRRIIPTFPRLDGIRGQAETDVTVVIERLTRAMEDWGQRVVDALDEGIPTPHAHTHLRALSVVDGLGSEQLPSSISVGQMAAIGDPAVGFATAGHQHGTGDLDVFGDVTVDPTEGTAVSDRALRRLLEAILLGILEIEELIGKQTEGATMLVPRPIRTVGQATSVVQILDADAQRKLAVIFNDNLSTPGTLYLKYGSEASTADFSRKVPTGSEVVIEHSGRVTGIWDAAGTGKALISEVIEVVTGA